MPGTHARLSPSGAKGWMACAGRLTLEAAFPNTANTHSDAGTACHTVASEALTLGGTITPADWLGEMIKVSDDPPEPPPVGSVIDGYKFNGGDAGKPENWEKV